MTLVALSNALTERMGHAQATMMPSPMIHRRKQAGGLAQTKIKWTVSWVIAEKMGRQHGVSRRIILK